MKYHKLNCGNILGGLIQSLFGKALINQSSSSFALQFEQKSLLELSDRLRSSETVKLIQEILNGFVRKYRGKTTPANLCWEMKKKSEPSSSINSSLLFAVNLYVNHSTQQFCKYVTDSENRVTESRSAAKVKQSLNIRQSFFSTVLAVWAF